VLLTDAIRGEKLKSEATIKDTQSIYGMGVVRVLHIPVIRVNRAKCYFGNICKRKIRNSNKGWQYFKLMIRLKGQTCVLIYKGKAIPLQAWTRHDGSRSLRLSDLKTIGT
jgi:hypothetical protein